ncbi:MAG: hypothetical protein ACRDIC_06300 [bacterium]
MPNREMATAVAIEAVQAALRDHLRSIPGEIRPLLIRDVAGLIEEQVQRERARCVEICRRRADLWRDTSASRSPISLAREEARARANEALYLADFLASGEGAKLAAPRNDDA